MQSDDTCAQFDGLLAKGLVRDFQMLKYVLSDFLRPTLCGFACLMTQNVFSQEPIELPIPVGNVAGLEEIAADVDVVRQGTDIPVDDGEFETLTRGPLHEAFAEPIVADPVPGFIVAVEPPPPINELMPEFRPDGDDAIWIAGYWGWDEQREDFIWISGVYRVPPIGHQWVPGYWHQIAEGWQWVQGFWVEDIAESIAYLPSPPATLENGPSSPSPGVDYFYIPGNWSQSSNGFAWSAGYWHPMQDDLVWVPSHTVWTPRGCVYVAGYWDQRLPLRGLCFAPVSVSRVTYSRPGWYLRPNVVLNSQLVLQNLFVQPGYNHYLFGDYYGMPVANRNVLPAYAYHQRRGSSDPLISFYSAYNARQGQDMIGWYGNHYTDLNRHPEKRPAQNWSPDIANSLPGTNSLINQPFQLAHSLDQVNKIGSGLRVSPISENYRRENLKRDGDHKQLARDRELSERNTGAPGIATLVLPKSEFSQRSNDLTNRLGKLPEKPRFTPNAGLIDPRNNNNVRPQGTQLPGNLDSKGNDPKRFNPPLRLDNSSPLRPGRIAPEVTRRMESIPRNVDPKREGNRDKRAVQPNEGTPPLGRIFTPNQVPNQLPNQPLNQLPNQPRTFDSPRRLDVPRNGEPNRLENNRLENNRFDANRNKEQSRRIEPPKIQIPNPQPPLGNPQPLTEIRNRSNAQGETRNAPFTPPAGSTSTFKPPVLPQTRRQENPPATRSDPPAQVDRQPRFGNRLLNDRANSGPKDAEKKPK